MTLQGAPSCPHLGGGRARAAVCSAALLSSPTQPGHNRSSCGGRCYDVRRDGSVAVCAFAYGHLLDLFLDQIFDRRLRRRPRAVPWRGSHKAERPVALCRSPLKPRRRLSPRLRSRGALMPHLRRSRRRRAVEFRRFCRRRQNVATGRDRPVAVRGGSRQGPVQLHRRRVVQQAKVGRVGGGVVEDSVPPAGVGEACACAVVVWGTRKRVPGLGVDTGGRAVGRRFGSASVAGGGGGAWG